MLSTIVCAVTVPLKRKPQARAVSGLPQFTISTARFEPLPTQYWMAAVSMVASTVSVVEEAEGSVAAVAEVIVHMQLLLISITSPLLIGWLGQAYMPQLPL